MFASSFDFSSGFSGGFFGGSASKMIRISLTLALATGVLSTLSGCTDDEVAASALAIAAGVIITSDSGPGYHHGPRHDGYGPRRDDRPWGPGRGRNRLDASPFFNSSSIDSKTTAAVPTFVSTDARVIAVANDYEISHYAATYVVRAIVLAEAKDTSGITDLGLTVEDFKNVYDGRTLAPEKISALATKLIMDEASTERLVRNMTSDVQSAKVVSTQSDF